MSFFCKQYYFFVFRTQKEKSCFQAFLAETVETGNKNFCETKAMHNAV